METGTSATRRTGRASSLAGRIWTTVAERGARWLFVGPPLCVLVALTAYPTIYLVRLALSRFEIASMAEPQFIGLANFPRLFVDAKFIGALGNTLIISVGAVA